MQLLLPTRSHRAPCIPDLLIAAAAGACRTHVQHVDNDFDLIATYTGQLVERLDG